VDKLTYTQHSVAWPTLRLAESYHRDEITVSLDAEGGGTNGEVR
jgi:hypothetical protein